MNASRNLYVVRQAVRHWVAAHCRGDRDVVVALSGGADSTALCAAAAIELPGRVHAVTVDHGLQADSSLVAEGAASLARDLGCASARVITVNVSGTGGIEAAARRARYAALDDARGGAPVLIAHTLDDQAETVLLGFARGSGPRSISGMRPYTPPWGRPLLDVRRHVTRAACAEIGVTPHEDPHNSDPRFTRVRIRNDVLPLLEETLGGGVAEALARTAAQLREDADVLDALAATLLDEAQDASGLQVAVLADAAPAVRRRAVRRWLLSSGVRALTDAQLRAIDVLVTDWRGQGPVAVPNGIEGVEEGSRLVVERRHGTLAIAVQQRR